MSRLGPFIIDVEGTRLTARDRELLAHPWVGGVIYFTRNFENKTQIAALTARFMQWHGLRAADGF